MKKGISLVMVVITLVILSLLSTVVIISAGSIIRSSKLNNFSTNMSKIQDSVISYYATRGNLPIKSNSDVFNKMELLGLVEANRREQLSTELNKNGDNNSDFYYVDVEKLGLHNLALDITTTSNSLIVNSEGTHVYYIEGYEINGVYYFSITKDMEK